MADSNWTNRVANTGTTSTTYAHTGLSAGDTRHYRVSAINSVGTGDASNSTTPPPTTPPCPAPRPASRHHRSTSPGTRRDGRLHQRLQDRGFAQWPGPTASPTPAPPPPPTPTPAFPPGATTASRPSTRSTGAASSTANATTDDAATTVPGAPTGLSATAERDQHDQPLVDRADRQRRRRHHRLQDRGLAQPRNQLRPMAAPPATTRTGPCPAPRTADGTASTSTGPRRPTTAAPNEVSSNGSSGWSNLEANTNTNSTTYAHTGLSAGDTRHYRVSAINSVGTGTPPAPPTPPPTTPPPPCPAPRPRRDHTIDLDTAPTDNGGSDITGYRIEVSSNGSSGWSNREANTNSTPTYLCPHRPFRRRHPDQLGRHRRPPPAPPTPPPTTPPPPCPAPHGTRSTSTGPRRPTTGHHRLQDRGFLQRQLRLVQPRGQHQQHQHHLRPHRPFRRRHPPLPGLGDQLGTSTIDLDWTAPTDNGGSDITGYRIEVSLHGRLRTGPTSRPTPTAPAPPTPTPAFPPATPATTGSRRSTRSAPATPPTSTTPPPTTPDRPLGNGRHRTIDLSWTAPTDNGGSAITGYRFRPMASKWTNREANTNSTSTTYAHTGLSAATLPRLGHQLGRHRRDDPTGSNTRSAPATTTPPPKRTTSRSWRW